MRWLLLLALIAALAIGATSCGDSGPSGPDAKVVEEFEDLGLGQGEAEAEVAAANRAAAREVQKEEKQFQRDLREEEASERQQVPKPESEPQAESASGGFTGVHASNYEAAKEICSAFLKEQIARELGLPASADEFEIAEAYADDGYTDRFQQAGFEGCL